MKGKNMKPKLIKYVRENGDDTYTITYKDDTKKTFKGYIPAKLATQLENPADMLFGSENGI